MSEATSFDSVPPPPSLVQILASQALPTTSHDQTTILPPIVVPIIVTKDTHSYMNRLEYKMKRMRGFEGNISWDDIDGMSVATFLKNFRMPDIKRYTGVSCPHIHLRLYNTFMRVLGLDKAQLVTLFPLSLSGATQR